MTKRERVEKTWRLEKADRPPFVPAVYEHKARLIGKSPAEVCRSPELLESALRRELEIYDPDMLAVGVDVYNVEAEALGCTVRTGSDPCGLPAIVEPILRAPSDLDKIGIPDPSSSGRMPMMVDTASRLHADMGHEMIIRGALSGPFSMASALTGHETLLVACLEEPAFTRSLLEFCGRVCVAFGSAFLDRGAGVVIFDSKACPGASSPRIFHDFVLPVYRDLVMPGLRSAGARNIALIIGGDTTSIMSDLPATGATQLLCDAGTNIPAFAAACRKSGLAFRANVDARLVHQGPIEAIRRQTTEVLRTAGTQPGFLLGCGVVAYDCEPDHVLAIRDILEQGVMT
ncbi:MAG: uroporphyrinogen decarboxylase family protein [Acidobacteriota bacterium]|nr:uroporphyrinogen decarboxylase family protein [Acidobacteriota bacterium]